MSDEKMPPVGGEANDGEVTESTTQDIARMHSSETPESALILQKENEISPFENSEAKTNEPPETIVNVSEVVGIAEEQITEINVLGDMSRELYRANNVLERINGLTPEQIKPREVSLVSERKAYIENFITETRELKNEATKEGVALLRGLPNREELSGIVSLDDEATIAELTLRKKDKNQTLSKDEEVALSRAFKNRDRFFDQLKTLGIERNSARVLYQRMLSEKTAEIREQIPQAVNHDRKIEEAKDYFDGAAVQQPEVGPVHPRDMITPFLTPEVLAAIEELNNQPTEEELRERESLKNVSDVQELLNQIPSPEPSHEGLSEEMLVAPEMIEALRRDGIHVKEGKKLTALEALTLRRRVLGKRGTDDILRTQERAAKFASSAPKEDVVPEKVETPVISEAKTSSASENEATIPTLYDVVPAAIEGIEVHELDVEEITIPPVSSVRTEETRRQAGRELLDWETEELGKHEAIDYVTKWENMSEEERKRILTESRFLFTEGKNYRIARTSGAIEEWTLFSILDNGDARMFSPDGQSHKDVPLLELRNLNIVTETPEEVLGSADREETMNADMLSASQIKEQIAALESQPSLTSEEEEKLKGLRWLRDNAEANGLTGENTSLNIALREIERLLPKAILSQESKSEVARVSALILPDDARILARAKEDVLANGTKEEQDAYRSAEERWESFMNTLEDMGIDPDIAEKIYDRVAAGEVKSIDERVIAQYGERFNIDKKVLEGIVGFADLTPGQQLLVLENFEKTAAKDVSVEGLKAYKEDLAKSGFFGRAWKNMTKQYQLGKAKGAVAEEWREGNDKEALAMKRDTLEGLTKLALTQKEFDVIEKDGTLQMQFAREELFAGKELSDEEKNSLTRFNEAANRYANLDFTGMKGEKEDFREVVEREYQTALEAVTAIYGEHNPKEGVEWQHKVRSAVQMNRFFADNPELEKDLDRSAGMTAFLSGMNTLTERGTIMGAGIGLRVAAVSALGTAGLFVAAPFVGGYLGAKRAKQSIEEKDLLARMGEHDMSDEARHEQLEEKNQEGAKNIINEKDVAKNIIDADILIKKLTHSLRDIDEVSETQMVEQAKRDASGALVRDEKGDIVKETVSKKEQLLSSLDARIEYTKRKLEEELVNLGGTNNIRINAINDLMEALGHAEARVALENPENKNVLTERLDNLLDIRKEKIEDNRKYLVRKEAVKGATLSLGFAIAGTGIGWAVRHGIDAGWFGGGPKPVTLPHEALGVKGPATSALVEGKAASSAYQSMVGRPVSETEVEMLTRAGQDAGENIGKGTLYGDMLEAVKSAKAPLSELDLARIIQAHSTPEEIAAGGGPIPGSSVVNEVVSHSAGIPAAAVAHALEATPKVYSVGGGDTLTSILKQHVSEVRTLSSDGQENAIQNFLRSLSSEDLRQIGVTDPNRLSIGQSLNLEKVVQLLHEKQVGGADILKHAEILTTPKAGVLESTAVDMHASGVVAEAAAITPSAPALHDIPPAHAPLEAATTGTPGTLHAPSPAEAIGSGNGAAGHVAAEAQSNWHNIPEAVRLPQAAAEAQRYLEDDITKLYGPQSKFGYWPREWTTISLRSATAVLAQTKETNPQSLLPGADEIPPGYEWSVVNKMQQYLREQGLTKEHGFVPHEKESIADFIKRAYAEKIMNEGPTRPPQK